MWPDNNKLYFLSKQMQLNAHFQCCSIQISGLYKSIYSTFTEQLLSNVFRCTSVGFFLPEETLVQVSKRCDDSLLCFTHPCHPTGATHDQSRQKINSFTELLMIWKRAILELVSCWCFECNELPSAIIIFCTEYFCLMYCSWLSVCTFRSSHSLAQYIVLLCCDLVNITFYTVFCY
jgi:hypothetical protein